MIFILSAFPGRHRRAVAAAGGVVAVAEIAAVPVWPLISYGAIGILGSAAAALCVAVGWATNRRAPTALLNDARERALRTPRSGADLLAGLTAQQAFALAAAFTTTEALHGEFSRVGVLGAALFAALLGISARSITRGVGVTLRPDGIHADKVTGELFVPWEALAPRQPGPGDSRHELSLVYVRPDLVRATGVHAAREDIEFEGVDPAHLATAIRSYLLHPEVRHAIGTAAEEERLRAEPGLGGYGLRPLPGPPAPRTTAIQAVAGAVLLGGATTLQTGLENHPHWSAFAILPAWLGVGRLRRAWAGRSRRRDRRA